jgi:homogentisate 1,2-dioxygenase
MPFYVRAGAVPPKRHIQFRRPDGGLYAEELFSTKGFESIYSLSTTCARRPRRST